MRLFQCGRKLCLCSSPFWIWRSFSVELRRNVHINKKAIHSKALQTNTLRRTQQNFSKSLKRFSNPWVTPDRNTIIQDIVPKQHLNTMGYSSLSDAELFERICKRTSDAEHAFNELYNRYSPRIYAYCLKVLGNKDEARDVFQDTFIRFYKSASEERNMTNIAGFLLTIARNLCLNHKRDTRPTNALDGLELPAPAHGTSYEESELLNLISVALDLLDAEHREAFVLREYDGLSYQEIGEVVGTNEATAKTRAFRAKQKLRQILMPYLQDLERS